MSKVAITAASSFTGLWILEAFASGGFKTAGLSSRASSQGGDLSSRRLQRAEQACTIHYNIESSSGSMEKWIREHKPHIWVHHHHFMENFRSPQYDLQKAFEVGVKPVGAIVAALSEGGCKGIIYSGSYFEPGEGGDRAPFNRTPYSESKKRVWEELGVHCAKFGIPLSKVVIPNPIGPFENEDRLIPFLLQAASKGTAFKVTQPEATSDNIPWYALAETYVEAAQDLLQGKARVVRPSGKVSTVLEFVNEVQAELIVKGLGLGPAQLDIAQNPPAPSHFANPSGERRDVDWNYAWSEYARLIK